MRTWLTAFGTGGLFGFGLAWSGMTNPARVLAFLDITGDFDPTLALVMGGALAVTFPSFAWILKWPRPVLERVFRLPTATRIDGPLLGGAALFGLGWGLAGLCPGPAIAGLVTGSPSIALFCIAMVAGQWLAGRLSAPR
jgi:uncharacterized membrane protein YedE/YeeE